MNFRNATPSAQFLFLIIVFCFSLVITSILIVVAMIPFTGMEIIQNPGIISNYSDPIVIKGLKAAQIINVIGLFIVPAFIFAHYTQPSAVSYLSLNKELSAKKIVLGILLSLVALPLINYLAHFNSNIQLPDSLSGIENWMKEKTESYESLTKAFMKDVSIGGFILNLFIMAFLAAFGEELLFRATLQQHLARWMGKTHAAIWLSAFIFSAIHFEFYGFIPRLLLGVMLGYLYTWSGSIWLPILVHFCNNAFAVTMQYLINKNMISESVDQLGSTTEELVYTVLGTLLTTAILLVLYRQRNISADTIR